MSYSDGYVHVEEGNLVSTGDKGVLEHSVDRQDVMHQ